MLTTAKLGRGQEDYYLESVAKITTEYYQERGEVPGLWVGGGRRELGLEGRVDAEDLQLLLEAREPASGERLSRHAVEVPGWDATVAAPKSVSVLWGIGHDLEWGGSTVGAQLEAAHDAAAAAAFGYLESEIAFGSRGHAREFEIETSGLVAAAFRHRSAREVEPGGPMDPHLHTHFVMANQVRGVDGRWGALDSRRLYTEARKTAGMLYQAELRWRATEALGVEWGEVKEGQADLAVMPREVVEHFSKRQAQVEGRLAEVSRKLNEARREIGLPKVKIDSVQAYEIARRETRAAKNARTTTRELIASWQADFKQEFINEGEPFMRSLLGRVGPAQPLDEEQRRTLYRQVAARLTEQSSTFDRRQVIQEIAAGWEAGMPTEQVLAEADRFLASELVTPVAGGEAGREVIRLQDGRTVAVPSDERRWTTPEMLETEQRVVRTAVQRQNCRLAQVDPQAVERAIAAGQEAGLELDPDQETMVRQLTSSGHGVEVVKAAPGTGKTTALRIAAAAWEEAGHQVVGATLSAAARDQLQEGAGIRSFTIARALFDLEENGDRLPQRSVMVIDEAGMAGTRQLARLLKIGRRDNAKLVLVGDDRQLPEIDAGGAFRGIAKRIGFLELTENHRQVEAWERAALKQMREGQIAEGLAAYAEHDRISYGERADRMAAMVLDWLKARDAGEAGLMMAGRRRDVEELNRLARAELVGRGQVAGEGLTVGRRTFGLGDEVLCHRNAWWERRVINGTRGHVSRIEGSTLIVTTTKGRTVKLDGKYLAEQVSHGYAQTVHKAQGATCDRSFNLITAEDINEESGLVMTSRGRLSNQLYWAGARPSEDIHVAEYVDQREQLDILSRQWQRSRGKEMAIDLQAATETVRSPAPGAGHAARRRAEPHVEPPAPVMAP